MSNFEIQEEIHQAKINADLKEHIAYINLIHKCTKLSDNRLRIKYFTKNGVKTGKYVLYFPDNKIYKIGHYNDTRAKVLKF